MSMERQLITRTCIAGAVHGRSLGIKEFKRGNRGFFDPCINAMEQQPYCLSRIGIYMKIMVKQERCVSAMFYCTDNNKRFGQESFTRVMFTFGFDAIIRRDLHTLLHDSPRDNQYACAI